MGDAVARWWADLTDTERQHIWSESERLLHLARAELPYPLAPAPTPRLPLTWPTIETRDDVEEYLRAGEYGAAWELLAIVAKEVAANVACWQYLARAASIMNMRKEQAQAEAMTNATTMPT